MEFRLNRKDWLVCFGLALILAGNAVFLNYNAFRCFNFFDMGAFIDASWRVYTGQKPYVDFIFTTGPVYLYLNAFFYKVFGFGKAGILAHLICVNSAVIVLTFFLTFRRIPIWATFLLTLLSTASFYWPISHPWYDQTAHLWGIIAVSILAYNLPLGQARQRWVGFFCGSLVMLAVFSKTNIGGTYFLIIFISFLFERGRLRFFQGYFAGIITVLGIMAFIIQDFQAFIQQTVFQFGYQKANRLYDLAIIPNWMINFHWLPALVVLVNFKLWKGKDKVLVFLFWAIVFASIIATHTSNMLKAANIPLLGIYMSLAFLLLYKKPDGGSGFSRINQRALSLAALSAVTVFFTIRAAVFGLELKAWTYMGPHPEGNYAIKAAAFKGWLCDESQGVLLDEMVTFFNKNISKDENLLIMGDIQVLYALTGRESYKGVPFLFQTGDLPVKGKQTEMVRSHILSNLPDWIIWDMHEPTYGKNLLRYLGIEEQMYTVYIPVKVWKQYALLMKAM